MSSDHGSSRSLTRRLVYALALVPIVPTLAAIGMMLGDNYLPQGLSGELDWFGVFFSTLCVTAAIAIWRPLVVWTLGRKWLTALVSLIPFVQIVYARPLWDAPGCGHDAVMSVGQHQLSIGVWVWMLIWVWWGWERIVMSERRDAERERGIRMTPAATRLAASIGLQPFVVGVFVLSTEAFNNFAGVTRPEPHGMACSAVVAVVAWVLIWRRVVVWTGRIRWWTIGTALLLLGAPVLAQMLWWDHRSNNFLHDILMTSSLVGWGLWMAVTIRIWPMKPEALGGAGVTPRCLKCGYLLTGLRATKCPECGDEPTIDELFAATSTQW